MTNTQYLSPLTKTDGRFLFQHKVIGRYKAEYFIDDSVGYIWAGNPTWLDEAYSDAIALTDTGVFARNLKNIEAVSAVLRYNGMSAAQGIDIGAGYGLFVRGMRDIGHDFYWSDKYADNLVARGFEADQHVFDVAVAFEVLEHLPNPLKFLIESRATYNWSTLFFSATCFDKEDVPGTDWWYWAFETGQHISFFSYQCLEFIAEKLGLYLVHLTGDLYAFTDNPKLTWPARKLTRSLLRLRFKRASLTQSDYETMKARLQTSK